MKSLLIWCFVATATTVPLSLPACGLGFTATAQGACCKVCRRGKACGNSCIARDRNCHQPRGCACDG